MELLTNIKVVLTWLDPDQPDTTLAFNLQNIYSALSLYYRHVISEKTFLVIGSSYSQNGDTVHWGGQNFDKQDSRAQAELNGYNQLAHDLYAICRHGSTAIF